MKSLILGLVLIATGSVAQAASTYTGNNACCKGTDNKFKLEPQAFTAFSQTECTSKDYVFYANQKNCPICCSRDHNIVNISDWQHITTACARPNAISWTGNCQSASPSPSPSVSPTPSPSASPSPSVSPTPSPSASPTPTPKPTATPWPSPNSGQSGACCKAKANANPVYDCSQPVMNFGHPQGLSNARERCNQVYMGNSCEWSTSNRQCCAEGIPGCNSATPTPTVHPTDPLPPVGHNGKCCVQADPRVPFDCASRETPTWLMLNAGVPMADALKKGCQLQFTANDHYCKWDFNNPDCKPKKDPCEERGMFSVKGDKLNVAEGEGQLCCTSKNPKVELLAGNKVCCEVIRKRK